MFGMAWIWRDRYAADLMRRRKEAEPQRAVDQGKTSCCRSGLCCWQRPGQISKTDIVRMAAHAGQSVQDFFREKCVVDTNAREGLTVRPRRKGQEGGRYLSASDTYDIETPCLFLDTEHQNACLMQEAKPTECATSGCWQETNGEECDEIEPWTREEIVALGWNGEQYDD